jgi:hypothetical protein
MAHFLYPLRNPTPQEKDAFALPREQGLTKVHHDRWSIGIGSRLIAKCPFSVGDLLCLQNEEFVVVDKAKSENKYTLRLVRDNKIAMEANAEEVDTHFYVCPGQEFEVNNADVKKLLGKAVRVEGDEHPEKPDNDLQGADEKKGKRDGSK